MKINNAQGTNARGARGTGGTRSARGSRNVRSAKGAASFFIAALLMIGMVPAVAFGDVGVKEGGSSVTQSAYGVSKANVVYFGSYEQANDGGSPEPIAWRVLSNANGKLFLLADKNLDGRPYNATNADVTWATSSIRTWLNETFYTQAFSAKEQSAITTTAVTNGTSSNPSYPTLGGANTQDKLFLLSIAEATSSAYGFVSDASRAAANTTYAASKNGGFAGTEHSWWLRSPASVASKAVQVNAGGSVVLAGENVGWTYSAVRPALNLNLASILFTSAASGANAKSSATVGGGLVGTSSPSGALKFTLSDAALKTPTVTLVGTTNGTSALNFAYSGATTGTNQYVSCTLEQSGAVKYYGKLANAASAASGTLSIPVSAIPNGTYNLKVFSEQANGNNLTDFASAASTTTLTVTNGTATVGNFVAEDGSGDSKTPSSTQTPIVKAIRTPLSKVYIKRGTKITLPVVIDADKAGIKPTYKSSKPKVATVNATTGKITAKKVGKTTISISAKTVTKKITVNVTKKKTTLKSIKVSGLKASYKLGASADVKLKLNPTKATFAKVSFKSSKGAIFTVDKAGRITFKATGKATLTVKAGSKAYKKTIVVKK